MPLLQSFWELMVISSGIMLQLFILYIRKITCFRHEFENVPPKFFTSFFYNLAVSKYPENNAKLCQNVNVRKCAFSERCSQFVLFNLRLHFALPLHILLSSISSLDCWGCAVASFTWHCSRVRKSLACDKSEVRVWTVNTACCLGRSVPLLGPADRK